MIRRRAGNVNTVASRRSPRRRDENDEEFFSYFGVGTAIAGMVYAQQSPVDLAVESYKFIETSELKLQGAINGGSKADYDRFIWKPTLEQFQKWPSMEKEQYNKYRPCQFAVDSFRVYSEDQFKASGY